MSEHVDEKSTWLTVPVFADKLKPVNAKPGYLHTSVGLNAPQGEFGELFFKKSSLKQTKSAYGVMVLPLLADHTYNVGFRNAQTKDWSYVNMTGKEIKDANAAYIAEKRAEKESEKVQFDRQFNDKFKLALRKAEVDFNAGGLTGDVFSDGKNIYTRDELHGFMLDQDEIDRAKDVLAYEMKSYFGCMNAKERDYLTDIAIDSYNYDRPSTEGRVGVLLMEYGSMAVNGYSIDFEDSVALKCYELNAREMSKDSGGRRLPNVPVDDDAKTDAQYGA